MHICQTGKSYILKTSGSIMYFLGGISGGLLLENKKSGFPTAVHSIREKIQATISLIYGNEDHASDT